MKKCPFCAEQIQDEAIKCRYCGSMLPGAPVTAGFTAADPLDADVRQLLLARRKIEAIKLVRERRGLGLKEAKDYVERFPEAPAGTMQAIIFWLVLIGVGMLVWYFAGRSVS